MAENIAFAHRRLAVRDRSSSGAQPMATPDGRYHLLYNGELYNDADLRAELLGMEAVPGGFRGTCDTETVLWAFATWGPASFERLRGMFAVAVYDTQEHALHLARDPLGIKPLYFHHAARELTFASEPKAILRHPRIEALPNLAVASAYLSTLRTTLGSQTLFHGVECLQPGERARFDARSGRLERERYYRPEPAGAEPLSLEEASEQVRHVLDDSVERHLHADVPLAAMLSGGLDSTVICWSARERVAELNTWCAGGRIEGARNTDFEFARLAADELGSQHSEVAIDSRRFLRDWPLMIQQGGLPLSTPNEVAIRAVTQDMRERGFVVALSGEGADELFGGYEVALQSAASFCQAQGDKRTGGRFQLESSAWVHPSRKPHLLSAEAWVGMRGDEQLFQHYDGLFRECEAEAGPSSGPLDPHLRFVRKQNLTGLLQRLDSASMMSSIEGRTPFADVEVARLADRLPMEVKWAERGKQCVREAFRGRIPGVIDSRPKQSFPLPFQGWAAQLAWRLETSPFAKTFYADEARHELAARAEDQWQLAWPMLNLALWGDSWWS